MTTVAEAMATAWQDISLAPRGRCKPVPTVKGSRQMFVEDWVWVCRTRDKHVSKSYWIPDEGRWDGYKAGDGPDMFQLIVVPVAP